MPEDRELAPSAKQRGDLRALAEKVERALDDYRKAIVDIAPDESWTAAVSLARPRRAAPCALVPRRPDRAATRVVDGLLRHPFLACRLA